MLWSKRDYVLVREISNRHNCPIRRAGYVDRLTLSPRRARAIGSYQKIYFNERSSLQDYMD
jgi:hypothetical protein